MIRKFPNTKHEKAHLITLRRRLFVGVVSVFPELPGGITCFPLFLPVQLYLSLAVLVPVNSI